MSCSASDTRFVSTEGMLSLLLHPLRIVKASKMPHVSKQIFVMGVGVKGFKGVRRSPEDAQRFGLSLRSRHFESSRLDKDRQHICKTPVQTMWVTKCFEVCLTFAPKPNQPEQYKLKRLSNGSHLLERTCFFLDCTFFRYILQNNNCTKESDKIKSRDDKNDRNNIVAQYFHRDNFCRQCGHKE